MNVRIQQAVAPRPAVVVARVFADANGQKYASYDFKNSELPIFSHTQKTKTKTIMLYFLKMLLGGSTAKTAIDAESAKTIKLLGAQIRSLGVCLLILVLSGSFAVFGYQKQQLLDAQCQSEVRRLQMKCDAQLAKHDSIIDVLYNRIVSNK
jgi:hypothetical protein